MIRSEFEGGGKHYVFAFHAIEIPYAAESLFGSFVIGQIVDTVQILLRKTINPQ